MRARTPKASDWLDVQGEAEGLGRQGTVVGASGLVSLGLAFLMVHSAISALAILWAGPIYGDVNLYEWWARLGIESGMWPVLDYTWVYPVAALVPIVGPALVTDSLLGYQIAWSLMVVLLNALATWRLAQGGRWAQRELVQTQANRSGRAVRSRLANPLLGAWYWLGFLLLLGPIWLGRLEGVIAPLIVLAGLEAVRRPRAAALIATLGAWIKVAPGAVLIALLATSRSWRAALRQIMVPAMIGSATLVGLAVLGGAGTRALSVFGEQGQRTLQAESVAATAFSVSRLWNSGAEIRFNDMIFTFEFLGQAARATANALDILLPVAAVAIGMLIWWSSRRSQGAARGATLAAGTFAVMCALIVFNKVGSPQFIAWLGPVVAVALATLPLHQRLPWRWPAAALLVVAALTLALYPPGYLAFLEGEWWMVVLAASRNLLVVALLGWAVAQIVRLARPEAPVGSLDVGESSRLCTSNAEEFR